MNALTERGERLSVLIPVFNNQATLDALCTRLREALNGIDYEVLLVDDGSRDESFSTLKGLAAGDPRLKVVSLSRNFGQHPAISAALDYATGDVIALMDADLEDQPEQIPSLLRTLREAGCDIVYTTKVGAAGGARQLTSEAVPSHVLPHRRCGGAARPRHVPRVHQESPRGVEGVSRAARTCTAR